MSSVAAELTFSGLVQGVGFRFYTYHTALQYNLTGWVKNNYDGSVSAWVQGDKGLVNDCIDQLKVGPPSATVQEIDIKWLPPNPDFTTFAITR